MTLGEKAPHRESSDEADDVELAENLQKASSATWTSRKGQERKRWSKVR